MFSGLLIFGEGAVTLKRTMIHICSVFFSITNNKDEVTLHLKCLYFAQPIQVCNLTPVAYKLFRKLLYVFSFKSFLVKNDIY